MFLEWTFIQSLNFNGLIEEDVDFVKSLYITKLNKVYLVDWEFVLINFFSIRMHHGLLKQKQN